MNELRTIRFEKWRVYRCDEIGDQLKRMIENEDDDAGNEAAEIGRKSEAIKLKPSHKES